MNNLSTEAILQLLNAEQQKNLFYALESTVIRDDKSIGDRLEELQEKYFNLVWFARSRPENHNIPAVKKAYDDVIAKYPKETKALEDENRWEHGFNSGVLACSRLLTAYALPHNHREIMGAQSDDEESGFIMTRESEIEQAEDDFPMLDT